MNNGTSNIPRVIAKWEKRIDSEGFLVPEFLQDLQQLQSLPQEADIDVIMLDLDKHYHYEHNKYYIDNMQMKKILTKHLTQKTTAHKNIEECPVCKQRNMAMKRATEV